MEKLKFTRTISTKLGIYIEKIMSIDRTKVYDTEEFMGLKIKGVDKFILDNGIIRHVQVKTKKNTLTGSQRGRTIMELSLHNKPIFGAAFDMGTWNFAEHPTITRMTGKELWSLCGLDYNKVLKMVCKSLNNIEDKLLSDK